MGANAPIAPTLTMDLIICTYTLNVLLIVSNLIAEWQFYYLFSKVTMGANAPTAPILEMNLIICTNTLNIQLNVCSSITH